MNRNSVNRNLGNRKEPHNLLLELEKTHRDHQTQLQALHPWQEYCMNARRSGKGIFWALPEVCLFASRQRRSSYKTPAPQRALKSMLFSHRKQNERKRFQLSVKFPAPAPKHRRARIIQRMSLQCSLSYQNEAFCLQLRLRNSRVVCMKHSRTLQPLPEP